MYPSAQMSCHARLLDHLDHLHQFLGLPCAKIFTYPQKTLDSKPTTGISASRKETKQQQGMSLRVSGASPPSPAFPSPSPKAPPQILPVLPITPPGFLGCRACIRAGHDPVRRGSPRSIPQLRICFPSEILPLKLSVLPLHDTFLRPYHIPPACPQSVPPPFPIASPFLLKPSPPSKATPSIKEPY